MIKKYIKEFENKTGAKVLYISTSGSKLYGTNTKNSDTDFKGIFLPSKESVLLKTDLDSYTKDTNNSKIKNSTDDVDFSLHSIYQFFNHLVKSETGSIDLLFSMFREDTIAYQDKEFVDFMKRNYTMFLNKNMNSFIGYSLGQVKKYGIKGIRYDSLIGFIKDIEVEFKDTDKSKQLRDFKDSIENITKKYTHIKIVMADGVKSNKVREKIPYVSVLGKLFHFNSTLEDFMNRIKHQENQLGNRTKTIAGTNSKTDFKSLSHSYRIAIEVKELLETNFIVFPLKEANKIRDIKQGKLDKIGSVEDIIKEIEIILNDVDLLLLNSKLPKDLDEVGIRKEILNFLR